MKLIKFRIIIIACDCQTVRKYIKRRTIMLLTAIIENNENYAEKIRSAIEAELDAQNVYPYTDIYSSAKSLTAAHIKNYRLIVFDASDEPRGLTTAHELKHIYPDCEIIIVAENMNFAVNGYSLDACGYILRQSDLHAFKNAVENALRKIQMSDIAGITKNFRFSIETEDDIFNVLMSDEVAYMEFNENNYIIHTDSKDYCVIRYDDRLIALLSNKGYLKSGNLFVNPNYITRSENGILYLCNGTNLPACDLT